MCSYINIIIYFLRTDVTNVKAGRILYSTWKKSYFLWLLPMMLFIYGCQNQNALLVKEMDLKESEIRVRKEWKIPQEALKKLYEITVPTDWTKAIELSAKQGTNSPNQQAIEILKFPDADTNSFYKKNQQKLYLLVTAHQGISKLVLFGSQQSDFYALHQFDSKKQENDIFARTIHQKMQEEYLVTILFSDNPIQSTDRNLVDGQEKIGTLSLDFYLK